MALQFNLIPIKDLARGLDLRSAESNVADGYSEDLQNVLTNSAGQLAKRAGYQGFAGYVPFRVQQVNRDGFHINFKLASSVDLTGIASSPLIVYGKLPSTESGDFSTTAALKHYASFSVDVRELFNVSSTTVTKSTTDHGLTSTSLFVTAMTSTADSNNSNSSVILDNVEVQADYDVVVTYTPPTAERVFVVIVDKQTVSGTTYVADYSGAAIAPSAGVVTGTILAATHGLGNFNIIAKCYTLSGGAYTEFIPDSLTIDDTTGDVVFTLSSGVNFDGKVVLDAVPADNFKQFSVAAGTTDTASVTSISTSFPYWSLYRLNGSSWELVIPDSVVTDDTTDTMTVSVTNSSGSPETYEFYYDFAAIAANTIRVVDSSGTTTSYTGTTITDPQLTIWGLDHSDRYSSSATRGGHVLHLDSYKRDTEARLVSGLGGNLYAARTRAEIGSTYQLPQLTVDLDARIASSVSMAPLFQTTGTSSSIRTRGIITGDNVANGYAVVSSVSYVSAGVADYTLSLVGKVGSLALDTQVATSDYLTVSGMAHSIYNGTFKISSIPTQTSSSVTVRVENGAAFSADFDETGAEGSANVFTDRFTTTAAVNYISGDIIKADSIDADLDLVVKSTSGTTVTVSGVTTTVGLAQGLSVFGRRTAYVQPLKNSASTPSTQYLVRGDMVTVTDLERQPRAVYVHSFQDMVLPITVSSGTATGTLTTFTVTSVDATANTFTKVAHGLNENDPVVVSSTGSVPGGLRADATYFVKYVDADTLKLYSQESGTVIDLSSAGSGTITMSRVHNLGVGQRITVAQTGDPLLDGVVTVVSTPARNQFTWTTTATTASATGVLVGRTAEFDEELTFTDALSSPTTVTVSERWIPIEAPTATGDLPKTTYTGHFDDTSTTLRSCIVGGNMYFADYNDEIMKFDGTSLYQAGLFRWQPQLFAQIDTGTSSLALSGTVATSTAHVGNKITVGTGEAVQFVAGDRVIYSFDSVTYTVQSVDTTNNLVYFTTSVVGVHSGTPTLKKVKVYKYYFRLNAYDANNNVIASAASGSTDFTVELTAAGQIRMRLVGLPAWGVFDYDRIELWTFRTEADTAAPFYRIRSVPVTFSKGYNYIDIYDGTTDEVLVQSGDLDNTMTALVGAELGTAWEQPPRAKYCTSVNNRLVLGNVKDYQQLDIVLRKQASAESVTTTNLNGFKMTFRSSSTDTGTTTNMLDRVCYEFVNSGAVTINPAADISANATTFTISEAAHGLVAGNWVYLFHAAAGADNDLHFAGWWQINSATTDTFTIKFANGYTATAADVDRYVAATVKTNIPVWVGTDGNNNTKYGNTSGSYEFHAALRLASAINSSMVSCDTTITGQTTFVPWLTANAGSEYGLGQLIVRRPKYSSTTMEVLLGTIGSNYDVFINNIKRASSAEVSATSLLFPSRVVISYENHPEIFDNPAAPLQDDSDSVVDVNSADGEEITGVIPFFAETAFGSSQVESLVVVFKTNSVYLLDVKTRQVQRIDSQGLGCTAPYSIAPTRNGIMFANLSGVYRLNRNLTVSYVGKFIERYWRDDVNADQLALATGHNYGVGRQYKLSVPVDDADENSVVLVYDHTREGQEQEFGAWTKFTNHPATGWANLDDDSFFASTTGQVFKVRTANDASDFRDDAAAVAEMVILLKSMDGGMPGVRKVCRNVILHMRMDKTSVTGATVYAAIDNDEVFDSAGMITATLGTKKVETFRVSLPVTRFNFLQLKITDATKDKNFVLAGVDLLLAALTQMGTKERSELS
jgi:hypothetical protein